MAWGMVSSPFCHLKVSLNVISHVRMVRLTLELCHLSKACAQLFHIHLQDGLPLIYHARKRELLKVSKSLQR